MNDIVLTADRTLMTDYNGLSTLGYIGCLPDRLVPNFVKNILFPKIQNHEATYSLRRVETYLSNKGFDVSILPPQEINKIKKIKPKVVGISTVDPLSKKPGPWTLRTIAGDGESVYEKEFKILLQKINRYKEKQKFKIIIGGYGANELANSNKYSQIYDSLIIGNVSGVAKIFEKAINNENIPKIFLSNSVTDDDYLPIIGPSRNGYIEITSGCPRHCAFCSPGINKHKSYSKERILKEVEINLKNNVKQLSLITEDILLYNSNSVYVNEKAVVDLIESIVQRAKHYDVSTINMSNVSVAATINGRKVIEQISDIIGISYDRPFDIVVGVETGSERLIKLHMAGKSKPYSSSKWSDLVMEAIGIQNDNYWYPWCSLITGLPGECEEDIIKTLDLIDNLKNNKLYFFIFYFVPMRQTILENEKYSSFQNVTERRWELFCRCWLKTIKSMNKNLLPSLYPSYSGKYIERVNRKISYFIIKKILKEIERDLGRYKNDPQGFKDIFTSINLKEAYLLKFFYSRIITIPKKF